MQELLEQTQAYLDYVKTHYECVQQAWALVQKRCSYMEFVRHSSIREILDREVKEHDASKLNQEEFTAYRRKFFPTKFETANIPTSIEVAFSYAWASHQHHNSHHWQHWTDKARVSTLPERVRHCSHMVIDWIAMAMQRDQPYSKYYRENKEKILIPPWAHHQIEEIFDCFPKQ